MAQPLRSDLYELKGSKPLLSVALHSGNVHYAVSSGGALTVVDGTTLEFYAAGR
jgi:hypothetical protein